MLSHQVNPCTRHAICSGPAFSLLPGPAVRKRLPAFRGAMHLCIHNPSAFHLAGRRGAGQINGMFAGRNLCHLLPDQFGPALHDALLPCALDRLSCEIFLKLNGPDLHAPSHP